MRNGRVRPSKRGHWQEGNTVVREGGRQMLKKMDVRETEDGRQGG